MDGTPRWNVPPDLYTMTPYPAPSPFRQYQDHSDTDLNIDISFSFSLHGQLKTITLITYVMCLILVLSLTMNSTNCLLSLLPNIAAILKRAVTWIWNCIKALTFKILCLYNVTISRTLISVANGGIMKAINIARIDLCVYNIWTSHVATKLRDFSSKLLFVIVKILRLTLIITTLYLILVQVGTAPPLAALLRLNPGDHSATQVPVSTAMCPTQHPRPVVYPYLQIGVLAILHDPYTTSITARSRTCHTPHIRTTHPPTLEYESPVLLVLLLGFICLLIMSAVSVVILWFILYELKLYGPGSDSR